VNWHRMHPDIMQSDTGYRVFRREGRYSAHAPDTECRGAQVHIGTFESFEDAARACEEHSRHG